MDRKNWRVHNGIIQMLALNGSMVTQNYVTLMKSGFTINFQTIADCCADSVCHEDGHTTIALSDQPSVRIGHSDRIILIFVDIRAECCSRNICVNLVVDRDNPMPDYF